jgi:hypothetical protein
MDDTRSKHIRSSGWRQNGRIASTLLGCLIATTAVAIPDRHDGYYGLPNPDIVGYSMIGAATSAALLSRQRRVSRAAGHAMIVAGAYIGTTLSVAMYNETVKTIEESKHQQEQRRIQRMYEQGR